MRETLLRLLVTGRRIKHCGARLGKERSGHTLGNLADFIAVGQNTTTSSQTAARFAARHFGLAYSELTRARQRDSKLSSSSIRACASMGPLRFSVATLTGAAAALACAGTAAGHFSNDFEITVLPAYQHFRPSIRRQDQCPCVFDGEALHCLIGALACAVSMPIGTSAEMQTAKKKTGRICIFIGHFPCG